MFGSLLGKFKSGDIIIVSLILLCIFIPDNYCFSGYMGVKCQIFIYVIILTLVLRLQNIIQFSSSGILLGVSICAIFVACVIFFTPYKHLLNIKKEQFVFISYAAPFIQFLIFESKKKYVQLLLSAIMLSLCILIIYISKSRAIFLAFFIETALFYILSQKRNKKALYIFLFFVISCAILSISLYIIRPTSVIGRCLIWRICLNILAKNWFTGIGHNGFINKYMLYQGEYLQDHSLPISMQYLVDDINTPYNEMLLLLIEHGIVVFIFVTSIIIYLIIKIYKNHGRYWTLSLSGLSGLFVISSFSYPLRYPISWLFLILFCALGLFNNVQINKKSFGLYLRITAITILISFFSIMIVISKNCYKWNETIVCSNPTVKTVSFNELSHTFLRKNSDFLYDYSYWLYQQSMFRECKSVLENPYSNKNYQNMMFLGEVHYQLSNYDKSIDCYRIASQMIPNRFSPLFNIVSIYEELGDKRMYSLADSIISKPVKIQSKEVSYIKDYCTRISNNK